MSNTGYRPAIEFFNQKGLSATEMTKELADVYSDSASLYGAVVKWVAEFKNPTQVFKDSPRND